MIQKILVWAYYILFFFTPLFFLPYNHELFEYNKMILVYGLSSIIFVFWLLRMVSEKKLIFKRTLLDIPIFLFLFSQILSTIFSIDPHTSLWGYYSRSNGGLLSLIAYIMLYFALVSNFGRVQVLRFLKAGLLGGLVVSLYAIPEHFGFSPSCLILVGRVAADCWVQDVQARVFATLGQPNWLAAYLEMLIFPAIYFALTAKKRIEIFFYTALVIIYYLAFTFTYSRGAMIGFLVGLILFLSFFITRLAESAKRVHNKKQITLSFSQVISKRKNHLGRKVDQENEKRSWKPLFFIIGALLIINLLFGSSLTGNFRLVSNFTPPSRPTLSQAGGTQLESGGTESGQIRLIVWKGAIEIFKHYPIFGSGVETFAYSYYNFRPVEHNLTSEWDFLYNKAHNEYLNYLANSGIVGFTSYILLILTFLAWSILKILNFKFQPSNQFPMFKILKNHQKLEFKEPLFVVLFLSSYVSFLVQNFFGFSVVVIAMFFILFPGIAFVFTDETKDIKFNKTLSKIFSLILTNVLYKNIVFTRIFCLVLIFTLSFLILYIVKLWVADRYFKTGQDAEDNSELKVAYSDLNRAVELNDGEPLYKSEYGFVLADVATALKSEDATTSGELANLAVEETEKALKISPKNVSLWRTAVRTYYQLTVIDPKFIEKALEAIDWSIKLAPTDPKLFYNKGLILSQNERVEEGVIEMEKAVTLKPDYKEAHFALSLLYEQLTAKNPAKTLELTKKAIKEMEQVLKYDPENQDAKNKIEELKKIGKQ